MPKTQTAVTKVTKIAQGDAAFQPRVMAPIIEVKAEAGGYQLAEQVTGICRGTLYALVHRKQIPHIRLSSKMVRFKRAALEAWMQERAVEVADEIVLRRPARRSKRANGAH
jgi:excisionase family DNA binding protein